MSKLPALLRRLGGAAISGGLVMVLIGVYYAAVKAGIPYQNPTAEMQIRYAIDAGIGDVLLKTGAVLAVCGGAAALVFRRKVKK